MDFSFSEEQLLFRDTVRDILTKECTPAAVRESWDNDTGRVPGLWATLAETGVLAVTAPESHGGFGMSEVDLVLLIEEFGRAAAPEPVLEQVAVAIPAIRDHGSGAQKDQWLGPAAAGEVVFAVGLDGSLVLGAAEADALVLRHGDELHLVVAADIETTPVTSIDQSRRLVEVAWTPSADTLLTADPQALASARSRGAMGAAALCVGIGQQLLDVTVAYVAEREQFGKPVGVNQAVKHHLSNVGLALEFARPMAQVAAWALAEGEPTAHRDASAAKALASDAVDLACRNALQCHGAIGYTIEYDLQLWLKRGWALAASWGDARSHRDQVATALSL